MIIFGYILVGTTIGAKSAKEYFAFARKVKTYSHMYYKPYSLHRLIDS